MEDEEEEKEEDEEGETVQGSSFICLSTSGRLCVCVRAGACVRKCVHARVRVSVLNLLEVLML